MEMVDDTEKDVSSLYRRMISLAKENLRLKEENEIMRSRLNRIREDIARSFSAVADMEAV